MSDLLNKSLDEIMGSKQAARPQRVGRSTRTNNNGKQGAKKVSSKSVGVSRRGPGARERERGPGPRGPGARNQGPPNNRKVAKILERAVSSINSNRVSVEGLPRDINRDSIREFFQQAVGGVASVLLSYNEKGVSLGFATITFKSNEKAAEAVKKFNGSPIDGGVRKLSLQMIVDPTKATLAARIGQPMTQRNAGPAARRPQQQRQQPQQQEKRRPAPRTVGNKKPAQKTKPAKAPKKSLEDLDKEMADYFQN